MCSLRRISFFRRRFRASAMARVGGVGTRRRLWKKHEKAEDATDERLGVVARSSKKARS